MTDPDRLQLWSDFLEAWPPEQVCEMTLEEYTNPDRDDAFIYWIESRLDTLGSIWGGSAFKFGIYHRDNTETKETSGGRVWGDTYAWLAKFGQTEQEAFATLRSRLVEVLDAALASRFERIDEIDLAPTLKWKVAFLYQNREHPGVFPIFKKEALFHHYLAIDPTAKLDATPYSVMYATLLERYKALGDPIAVALALWAQFEADKNRPPRAWAVPLGWSLNAETVDTLCAQDNVEPEDVDTFLENLLSGAEISAGDKLVLLVEGDVRAVGTFTSVEPGGYAWEQTPVRFPSNLLVNPTSEMKELDAAEWQDIWSQVPKPVEAGGDEPTAPGPRYWKIAPGQNAVAWDDWRERGIVAIGWPDLGDLTGLDRQGFDKRAAECAEKHGYRSGMNQVWTFRGIRPGDRIVANQGFYTALGVGTVVEGYRFVPGQNFADGEEYPHQLLVHWDDTTPRKVQQSGWRRTLLELSEADFQALLSEDAEAGEVVVKQEPPAPPCNPQNIIVYGPPGTGKTYSTVRRALELILGPEKLEGLSERGLTALFREHQARGQIEFVTFHQAYGYEEFVEGLRPVLDEANGKDVRYELHDGIFKRIALRAAAEGLVISTDTPDFDELWGRLVAEINDEGERVARNQSGAPYLLQLTSQGNIATLLCKVDSEGNVTEVSGRQQVASKRNSRFIWEHRAALGTDPEQFTYAKLTELFARERGNQGGNHYTALWLVYSQLIALSRSMAVRTQELVDRAARVQQELDKPIAGGASFSFSAANRQYVLIIDEINRGNVSKILGELITLLEPDKRLGARNELKLPLSYSPTHRFAIPPNLHVLGTMNTADRSIALMDAALRRRFIFEELLPSSTVIREVLRKEVPDTDFIDLVIDLFESLNARIRFLYDRDHQLGHAYCLEVRDVEDLRRVFMNRLIPLLQEYFYGAWDKICTVLGCPYDEAGEPKRNGHVVSVKAGRKVYTVPIVWARPFLEEHTLDFDHDAYDGRVDFSIMLGFQEGHLSREELIRTFLSVLHLDQETFASRLTRLMSHRADTDTVDVASNEATSAVHVEAEVAL